jgi:uncharacterized protein YecE (DUF72 family)
MQRGSNLRIGTSGWNYPSGKGTWNGVFYPRPRARPTGFDELSFYAEHFNTVEVNSTFYGQPKAAVCRAWADRTPEGFEFSVKLYRKFTHPEMFKETLSRSLSRSVGRLTFADGSERAALDALARPTQADLDAFRTGLEPIADRGRLGAVLAQFPPSFRNTPPARDYLAGLLRAFEAYPIAVELRHASWSDRFGETLALLNGLGAAWVQIDEPKFRFSIRQNYLPNVDRFYYMRLHGRNADKWWRHDSAEDRYDYLYSAEELTPFAETAEAARRLVKKLYLYTNNHFSAKSVANAVMIKQQLGEPIDGYYSPEFLARYPEVGEVGQQTEHRS